MHKEIPSCGTEYLIAVTLISSSRSLLVRHQNMNTSIANQSLLGLEAIKSKYIVHRKDVQLYTYCIAPGSYMSRNQSPSASEDGNRSSPS
jgi:hypothetical protein